MMSRPCTACVHSERKEIDRMLIESVPYQSIADLFSLSFGSVYRHKAHLNGHLKKAKEAKEMTQAETLLHQLKELQEKAMSILSKAEASQDWRTALGAIREARGCLELLAKLLGEINDHPVVNIIMSEEWIQLRTTILQVLQPYPDIRTKIVEALRSHECLS